MSDSERTRKGLKDLQALPMSRKVLITQTRITEWYQHFEGGVYVSFSGGKDSTVLLDIVRKMYPQVPAVFVDTGLEFPEIREFVKQVPNVVWVKPEMNFKAVVQTYGYPLISKDVSQSIYEARRKQGGYADRKFDPNSEYSKKYNGGFSVAKWKWLRDSDIPISHKCCDILKKKPAKKYEKESGNKPMTATMACESQLRVGAWLQHGCNAFDAKRPISQPMSFWTEQDVMEYIKHYNLAYASVYGDIVADKHGQYHTTGYQRTGCVFCGFGCHLDKEPNRFQRLKQTHPQLWDYCMRPTDHGGLGMREVLEFIGVKHGGEDEAKRTLGGEQK